MEAPTVQSLTTVAGAAILVAVLVQLYFNTAQPAPATQDRIGPLLAVILGVIVVELATATVVTGAAKADFAQGFVNGIFAGLASMGIHNVITKSLLPPPA